MSQQTKPEQKYRLTPQGVIQAVCPDLSVDQVKHIMDRLYIHALGAADDKNETVAIVWDGGEWKFATVGRKPPDGEE